MSNHRPIKLNSYYKDFTSQTSVNIRESLMRPLTLLSNGLLGFELKLQLYGQDNSDELPIRPILSDTHLFLPDADLYTSDSDVYLLYRAAIAHAVAHLRYSPRKSFSRTLKPMTIAVVSAIEDARVERLLIQDYPGVIDWFIEFHIKEISCSQLSFSSLISRMNLALIDSQYQDNSYWVNKAKNMFEAQKDLSNYSAFRRLGSILANDMGQMRLPFDPHYYVVSPSYRDDNSFLWDYEDFDTSILDKHEIYDKNLVIQSQQSQDLKTEICNYNVMAEVELERKNYPEWDNRLLINKNNWCTVIEKLFTWTGESNFEANSMDRSILSLLSVSSSDRSHRLRRQWEGDELDLNAAIEGMINRQLGLDFEPRFFTRMKNEKHSSSILVLLDMSESTNELVGNMSHSVLSVEKKAALLLAQLVIHIGDRIAIHGFSSNTRAEINYYRLLEFGEPLDPVVINKIQSATARYSTRMGAALRHAFTCLRQESTQHRAILLISDGAPSDVDVFFNDYLIEDARVAVEEVRKYNTKVYCMAIDSLADSYIRTIFGYGNYRIVDNLQSLPKYLLDIYDYLKMK